VLTDELTNRSIWGLGTGKNELTNRSVQIQKWIIDADIYELTIDQFIEIYNKDIDELTTDQFINADKKDTSELTTDQFTYADTM
jgi:hypothetical protein